MKKITLTFAAFIAAISLNAQTTLFSDDFNDEDISDWILYDEDGDGENWGDQFQITDANDNPVSPVSLISRSWLGSPLTPDNWVVSPEIDLTNTTNPVNLIWKVQAAAEEWDNENYTVYVGTSDDINGMTEVYTETYDDPDDNGTQYDREVDITSYAGQMVHIAFRHHDVTDQDWISIDDVMVIEEPTASLKETNIEGFSFYNNNSVLNLKANEFINQIKLYNILGQEVYSSKIENKETQLNIANLNAGVYLAKVQVEEKMKTFKFVKN